MQKMLDTGISTRKGIMIFNLQVFSLRGKFRLANNVVVVRYNEVPVRLIDYLLKETKLVKHAGNFDDRLARFVRILRKTNIDGLLPSLIFFWAIYQLSGQILTY